MVTLIITGLECYAKEVIEIFNHKRISRKDDSRSGVERVISRELGMTDPLKGIFSETWVLGTLHFCLHLKFHTFPQAFFDLLAGFFEVPSHSLELSSSFTFWTKWKKIDNNKQMGAKISPLLLIKSGLKNVAYVCRQVCFLISNSKPLAAVGWGKVPL